MGVKCDQEVTAQELRVPESESAACERFEISPVGLV